MHLAKLPTIFVKGGEERKAYFTVQARELIAAGWVEKVEKPEKAEKAAPVKEVKEEAPKEAKPRATKPKTEYKPVAKEDEIKIDE